MNIRKHYQSKQKRDEVYKELKRQGHDVMRSSSRGSLLHPQFVEDYEGLGKDDTGIGNGYYKMYWGVLYTVESRPNWMKK